VLRLKLFLLTTLVACLAVPAAFAGNAHFIKSATGVSLSGANLVCSFKEAGLESGSVETITCSGDEVVTYECVNGGGKNPSASNKRSINTSFSQSGTFSADRNGNVVGSQTISPASASSVGFSCPPGQTTTFVSVCYSNISISDGTSGASAGPFATSEPLCFTNPNAPPVSG
jgi:hypothetical protein